MRVAAGLVFRHGRLLIAQRRPGDHLGGQWEFPGGKVNRGESLEDCLRRELKEELGIEVRVGKLFDQIEHRYPKRRVRLYFFHCQWARRPPRAIGCQAFAWVVAQELSRYRFPPADQRLLLRLRAERSLWHDPPQQEQKKDSTSRRNRFS